MSGHKDDKDLRPKEPDGGDKAVTPAGDFFPTEGFAGPDSGHLSLAALRKRYDILAELGRGGTGIVYRARTRAGVPNFKGGNLKSRCAPPSFRAKCLDGVDSRGACRRH